MLEISTGDCFGEVALLLNTTQGATIRATLPTILWRVDGQTFKHANAQSAVAETEARMEAVNSMPKLRLLSVAQKLALTSVVQELVVPANSVVIQKGDRAHVDLCKISIHACIMASKMHTGLRSPPRSSNPFSLHYSRGRGGDL